MRKFISGLLIAGVMSVSTGCFGEFALVRGLRNWNEDVTDSRFVNNLVFYGLSFIQVYSIAGAGDLFIFNLIEFWTGDNPLAMQEGESDEQIIPLEGEKYMVQATKDQFRITKPSGEELLLQFDRKDLSWNMVKDHESTKLMSFYSNEDGNYVHLYSDDRVISLDTDTDYDEAFLQQLFASKSLLAAK